MAKGFLQSPGSPWSWPHVRHGAEGSRSRGNPLPLLLTGGTPPFFWLTRAPSGVPPRAAGPRLSGQDGVAQTQDLPGGEVAEPQVADEGLCRELHEVVAIHRIVAEVLGWAHSVVRL